MATNLDMFKALDKELTAARNRARSQKEQMEETALALASAKEMKLLSTCKTLEFKLQRQEAAYRTTAGVIAELEQAAKAAKSK